MCFQMISLIASLTSSLFHHNIDFITILHLETVRSVIVFDSFTIEDESALVACETLSLAVSVHQLLQLSSPFDFEVDLGAILRFDFDIDVLVLGGSSGGSVSSSGGSISRCGCIGISHRNMCDFEFLLNCLLFYVIIKF